MKFFKNKSKAEYRKREMESEGKNKKSADNKQHNSDLKGDFQISARRNAS
jgi:hypothetical protein